MQLNWFYSAQPAPVVEMTVNVGFNMGLNAREVYYATSFIIKAE